jgi:diketogulonate reductase-like aldo/keto reductase
MQQVEKQLIKPITLGLGTSRETTKEVVQSAIVDHNYRLIDTAALYLNEPAVGEAIKAAADKVPRKDLFIVSKIWNDAKEDVEGALRGSLKRLDLEYLDLYLIHWPFGLLIDNDKWKYKQQPLYKTWAAMEACVRKGLCKRIGVSNFNCQLILDLLSYAEIPPYANQIELHPYCSQRSLVKYCLANDIIPMAYGPLAAGAEYKDEKLNLLNDPIIISLAEKYKKTPGQICLQWGIANGHLVIPRTKTIKRLGENMESISFEMKPEELQKIDSLNKNQRIYLPNPEYNMGTIPIFS